MATVYEKANDVVHSSVRNPQQLANSLLISDGDANVLSATIVAINDLLLLAHCKVTMSGFV